MISATSSSAAKSTACFNFSIFAKKQEQRNGNRKEATATVRIKLAVSLTLRKAVDIVGSDPSLDTELFSSNVCKIQCANGVTIPLSFFDTALSDLHDEDTPIMNGEVIYILYDNERAGKTSGQVIRSSAAHSPPDESSQTNCNLFVRLRIPNSLTVVNDYRHFQASSTESFKNLFCRVIYEFEQQGKLDSKVTEALRETPVTVLLSDSTHEDQSGRQTRKVQADLSATCGITKEFKMPYLCFVPVMGNTTRRVSVSSAEVVAQLMASQRATVTPDRYAPKTDGLRQLPFEQRLFNFIIDLYETENLGVSPDRLDSLKSLTQTTRDALLHITGGEINQVDIPERFRITFTRENSRDRVKRSQEKMRGLAQNLLSSMNMASGFLALSAWDSFHADLNSLHNLLLDTASRMQQKTDRMRVLQYQSTSTVADKLKKVKVIPATKVLCPKYAEVNQKLAQLDEYEHLIFSSSEIDQWDPPPNVSGGELAEETNGARRKRRQRFREGMHFTFPARSFQYHPGGRLPILCAIWKIELNAEGDDCDLTKTLQCQARIQQELPKYCNRLEWNSFVDRFGDMFGGSVPMSALKVMYKELAGDSTVARDAEIEQRALLYVMSDSDNDYWPDLRAAINGRSEQYTNKPYILAVRSDGGSDRNPKNASVLLAYVRLWLKLDLDILVAYVTAADVSHVNEVEGVMPVANLALQNQAFARTAMSPEMEKHFKNANSGKAIRETIEKQPTQTEQDAMRQAWRQSIEPVRVNLEGRLTNIVYNEDSVQIFPPAGDLSVEEAYSYLSETIDSSLDKDKTTWTEIEKNNHAFTEFKRLHCKVGRYHAEIKKCGRKECHVCKPVRMPSSIWKELDDRPQLIPLPMPDLERSKEDNITRYKSYDELKTTVTHPRHRPSYTPPTKPSHEALAHDKEVSSKTRKDTEREIQESLSTAKSCRTKLPTSLWHSNCIRSYVKCSNCRRPRVVYAWRSSDPLVDWDGLLEELSGVTSETSYEYTCGDQLFGLTEDPVLHPSVLDVFHVKTAVTCGMNVQTQYFVDRKGFPPVCTYCGSADELASVNEVMKAALSNVKGTYPMCRTCVGSGKKPLERGRRNKTSGHGGKRKMGEFYQSATQDSTKKRKPPPSTAISSIDPEKLFSVKEEDFRCRDGKNEETKKPTSEEAEMADMLGCGADWQIRNVPGDGNCGYTATMMGLRCIGILESENNNTIGFRKALRKFAEENNDRILSFDEPLCINRSISAYATIRKGGKQFGELVLDGIFPSSGSAAGAVHFGEGGSAAAVLPRKYWLDAPYHLPLIVLKYGVTIVCYQVTTAGERDQEDGKMTSVYSYENGKVLVTDTKGIVFPDQAANATIHIVLHTSKRHFMYLGPTSTVWPGSK